MSIDLPLVSICIPVYNAAAYIDDTVNNFLNQTYGNVEIIINDDCSNDGTWDLLQKYKDISKVKLYRNTRNLGIGSNWNIAYSYAKGNYVVIANADDIHKNTFIEKAYKYITSNGVDFVTFKYQIFDSNNGTVRDANDKHPKESGVVNGFDIVNKSGAFHIIFSLFKKSLIDQCKVNNLAFMNTQVCDYEFLLRYSYYYSKAYYCNEVIGYYRIHETNNSKKPLGELKSYFYDVLPFWHDKLKDYEEKYYPRGSYRRRRWVAVKRYVKGVLRGSVQYDGRLLKTIVKFYIKSL